MACRGRAGARCGRLSALGHLDTNLALAVAVFAANRQGASISPPKAAVVMGTGTEQSRSNPSRSKSSWGATEDEDIKVASRSTARSGVALAGQADARAVIHAGGDAHLKHTLASNLAVTGAGHARIEHQAARPAAPRTGGFDGEEALASAHTPGAAARSQGVDGFRDARPSLARLARHCGGRLDSLLRRLR